MLSIVKTCVLHGLEGFIVNVETDLSNGLPNFNIVGLPDTSIRESKERVKAAIKNSGVKFPISHITVNLAPANLRKEGSQMDLPIAVGILKASNIILEEMNDNICFIGELSLNGEINAIDGALPMAISLRNMKIKKVVVPFDNKEECGYIEGLKIIPAKNLRDVIEYLNKKKNIKPYKTVMDDKDFGGKYSNLDYCDVKGQPVLKRAVEIAAAGSHNILMIGPPGAGKTMIARRLPTILPDLTFEEALDVTKIHSVCGKNSKGLVKERPFRAPHHTISKIALVGGGRIPKPGEVSLAHNGVLFLDEIPEFVKNVLEVLRQPMEDGFVSISRVNSTLTFPSGFMLVASMNPCACVSNLRDNPFQEGSKVPA